MRLDSTLQQEITPLLTSIKHVISVMDNYGWQDINVKKGIRHNYYRAYNALKQVSDTDALALICGVLLSRLRRAWDDMNAMDDSAYEVDSILAHDVEAKARKLATKLSELDIKVQTKGVAFNVLPGAEVGGVPD